MINIFSVILNLEDNPSSEYVTVVEPGEDFLESTFEHGGEFNILSVEPLVRCRECKYQLHGNFIKVPFCGKLSEMSSMSSEHLIHAKDDFYCANGVRKDATD